ncbi:MAG: 50S ribosomal protein L16 [Candidatus Nanoarchaeia archaeon]|nr:50S ribosomal protein L16 [Candidatus Nanoarchaeia archaeon]MDD3994094.1 50S ribosomal protein L16 [Candidatus Nanoarchaeia archaeon]MDD4563523.1 50S ribosomal protein L16 [Candidatus Nanoarchaeia archaeon]
MALRKSSAYSKRYARPYTRKSKVKKKSYIKTVPNSKIVKFKMGDLKGFENGDYIIQINVIAKEGCQLRDNPIEAVRQYLNRYLQKNVGKEFYLEVKKYPHHILRENKMLTGAGADRMQTGMARSFGKTIGRAAFVKPGQVLFIVGVKNEKHEIEARKLIKSIKARLPCKVGTQTKKL